MIDSVRDWIDAAASIGELREVHGAKWEDEIGAITEIYQRNPGTAALLFDEIPGAEPGHRVLSSILNSPARIAMTLGLDPGTSLKELTKLFRDRTEEIGFLPPNQVSHGPVFENELVDEEVDVTVFPTPLWHEQDGGRYIGTSDIVITRAYDSDWINVGTYRSMIHTPREVSIMSSPGKHGREHMEAYHEHDEACPIVIVCGANPALYWTSGMEVPRGESELAYAGWWYDEPVDVIESDLTGLPIPATAELVLEGYVHPGNTRVEGPLGEWTGYYAGGEVEEMVVDVDRILHRDDPIITGSPPSKPPCEEVYFRCPIRAGNIWNALDNLGVPGIEGVWCEPAGGSRHAGWPPRQPDSPERIHESVRDRGGRRYRSNQAGRRALGHLHSRPSPPGHRHRRPIAREPLGPDPISRTRDPEFGWAVQCTCRDRCHDRLGITR